MKNREICSSIFSLELFKLIRSKHLIILTVGFCFVRFNTLSLSNSASILIGNLYLQDENKCVWMNQAEGQPIKLTHK